MGFSRGRGESGGCRGGEKSKGKFPRLVFLVLPAVAVVDVVAGMVIAAVIVVVAVIITAAVAAAVRK